MTPPDNVDPAAPRRFRDLVPLPGFAGPLALLGVGLVLGVLAVPGPGPSALTWVSWGVAYGLYALAAALTRRGQGGWVVALLVVATLALVPLAFGPSPLSNRKITAFNAWAYDLGAHLPALIAPPPHPNSLAAGLAAGLGLLGAAWLMGPRRYRAWVGTAVVVLGGVLLLTVSRAGWLAAGGAALVLVGQYARRLVPMLLGALVLGAAALVLVSGPPLIGQPAVDSTESLGQRTAIWEQTLDLLRVQPWTGLGLARFPARYAALAGGSGQELYNTPHNTALELWADAGLCGLLALAWAPWRTYQLARRPAAPGSAWLQTGATAALVALAIHGVFETNVAVVWALPGGSSGYLAAPLPFVVLGLLAGAVPPGRSSRARKVRPKR
ncbi:MAG TPA: O-antigen ligase family protein [Chloroflexia bacterium]|nr:O-antigen ligase family protein [Chloroflexia bacterium]